MVDAGTKGEGPDNTMTGGATGDGDTDPPATTGDGTDGPPPGDGDTTPIGDGTDGTTDGTDGTDGTTDGTDGTTDGTDGTTDGTDGSTEPDAGSGSTAAALDCLGSTGPAADDPSVDCGTTVQVSGQVLDFVSGGAVANVNVTSSPCGAFATTDDSGSFLIDVPAGAMVYYHLDGVSGYEPGLSQRFNTDSPDLQTIWLLQTGYLDPLRGTDCMDPALIVARMFDNTNQQVPADLVVSDALGATPLYVDNTLVVATDATGTIADGAVLIDVDAPTDDSIFLTSDVCMMDQPDVAYPVERGYVTAVQVSMTCQ